MISSYYKARGWTHRGQIPRSKLISLGLSDVAADIGVEDTEEPSPADLVGVLR
jgi:hypothetical protein